VTQSSSLASKIPGGSKSTAFVLKTSEIFPHIFVKVLRTEGDFPRKITWLHASHISHATNLGICFQRRVNPFLFLKLPACLCFQRVRRLIQLSGGGGVREGKVDKAPKLKGEVAVQEEMGYGFEASRQREHLEGPWMPHFSKFSVVRIFP
jgi:hypothetical protein